MVNDGLYKLGRYDELMQNIRQLDDCDQEYEELKRYRKLPKLFSHEASEIYASKAINVRPNRNGYQYAIYLIKKMEPEMAEKTIDYMIRNFPTRQAMREEFMKAGLIKRR